MDGVFDICAAAANVRNEFYIFLTFRLLWGEGLWR